MKSVVAFITAIRSQVSEYFKDYDERLIFETMNEPRVVGCDTEWSGIPCIVWDNGLDFRLFDRTTHVLEFPDYIKP